MSTTTPASATEQSPDSASAPLPDRLSPSRLAANRRNAFKSTGPRTKAGKYRSALNSHQSRLCPEALERELRGRGEDPREFCRLHRDLVAILHPTDAMMSAAVELLARTWWQKARRIRQWVGAGAVRCPEIDARLDALLMMVVDLMRRSRRPWKTRLAAVVGPLIGSPSETRCQIEGQLSLFGANPASHKYPIGPSREELQAWIEDDLRRFMAGEAARKSTANEPKRTQAG